MLLRFCLYGFLKNLRLFDAFLLLALRDRGLDFAAIGALVAVREVAVLLLEAPSGALADTVGRRRCMVASMAAYVAFSLLFWGASSRWLLALGMVCYGVGDAFRSGTHKALILSWLRSQGRLAEKTAVYGRTRSWSQLGSACSAALGGALLLAGADYRAMFLAYAVVALVNLVNLATYPAALDARVVDGGRGVWTATWRRLFGATRRVLADRGLRPVVWAGVAVRGGYKVAKDYLQPVLQALVVSSSVGAAWSDEQRTGLLVGLVGAGMFVLASQASLRAHRFERLFDSADRAARALTTMFAALFALVGALAWSDQRWLTVGLFVLLAVGNNLWRPVQVGQLADRGGEQDQATVLSIEAQLGALFAAALAPGIGALVDVYAADGAPASPAALWPLGLLALPVLSARAGLRGARA
ncbi:MAG: MFS transporter [Planctomycetota bacterium]